MVSVETVRKILEDPSAGILLKHKPAAIAKCRGEILAQDLKAPVDSPNFEQSAMDGYAVRFSGNKDDQQFTIDQKTESKAGSSKKLTLKKGQAIPIYTGAPTPINADCVIPFEFTRLDNNSSTFYASKKFVKNDNIRSKGSHFKKSEILIEKGTTLLAPHIALMAAAGIQNVKVIKQPSVGLLVSGNEFCTPGKKLHFGQIYESNSLMLASFLEEDGISEIKISHAKDQEKDIISKLQKLLSDHDIIIISGGMSVGNYDLTTKALYKLKAEKLIHKVKQKPGKPFSVFRKGKKFIFGLPGNPGAAMMCYLMYIRPFISKRSGKQINDRVATKNIIGSHKKKGGLTTFLYVRIEGDKAVVLDNQESYKLNSYLKSDAIAELPEHVSEVEDGTEIKCHIL